MAQEMFERIESYLEGILSVEERLAFEKELGENAVLKEEYLLQKDTHALLNLHGQLAHKEKLKVLDREIELTAKTEVKPEAKTISIKKPLWRETWFQMAAVVLLLISSSYFWINQQYNQNQLLQSAFQPYDDILTGRGTPSPMQAAMQAYNQGKHEEAVAGFTKILEEEPQNIDATFYLGVSLLASEKASEAEPYLEKAANSAKYSEPGRWYKTLACFERLEPDQCLHELGLLAGEEGHPYQEKAGDLYEKLDSFWAKLAR